MCSPLARRGTRGVKPQTKGIVHRGEMLEGSAEEIGLEGRSWFEDLALVEMPWLD